MKRPRVLGAGGQFHYVHQLEDRDARVAILEFATEVGGQQVEGIDKLTFDHHGCITEMKVMLRPASALQVVGARIAEEFARLRLAPSPERFALLTAPAMRQALANRASAYRAQRQRPVDQAKRRSSSE